MTIWRRDLRLIANDIAVHHPDAIILGDFNATMRHGAMNQITSHEDALRALSVFQRGTWTSGLPSFLRSSIDHILLPKNQYAVKRVEITAFPASDHACVFLELERLK